MILQALNEYYVRQSAAESSDIAPEGFEWKEIPFFIDLAPDGSVVNVVDTRHERNKRLVAQRLLVPMGEKRTMGIAANLLWDNAGYVLGLDAKGRPERVARQHEAFTARLRAFQVKVPNDEGMAAVVRFYDNIEVNRKHLLDNFFNYVEIWLDKGANLSFSFHQKPVLNRPDVVQKLKVEAEPLADNPEDGLCLVSGEKSAIARMHTAIKGVAGAQSTGANIVSFNLASFRSHGKEQGANSPVGKKTEFQYTTALNQLLNKDSGKRSRVATDTAVFWAETAHPLEQDIFAAFDDDYVNPEERTERLANMLRAIQSGAYVKPDDHHRFYFLVLAPNASRLAIRNWQVATIREVALHIAQHFEDLALFTTSQYDQPHPSLKRLLRHIAAQGKDDNIPPNLAGDVVRATLMGLPYPQTFLQSALRRCKAEQKVSYERAAILKACINRFLRFNPPSFSFNPTPFRMNLDPQNQSIGYNLGRLFAVLVKLQEEANPGLNATIADRYYGAASTTPTTVFPILMKLRNHHLSKLDNQGRRINLEKEIGEILGNVNTYFPKQLSMLEQGAFGIGYYHQNQSFYTKKATERQPNA